MCTGTIFLTVCQDIYEIQDTKFCQTKGQSKGNFGVFNSSKNELEISKFCPRPLGQKFFVRFFGRIENTKMTFWTFDFHTLV